MDKDKDKSKDKSKQKYKMKDKDKDKKKGKARGKFAAEGSNVTRSFKAGIQFPVGRIHRYLKQYVSHKMRVGGTAGVYVASIMEYLTAEVMELAGNVAKD